MKRVRCIVGRGEVLLGQMHQGDLSVVSICLQITIRPKKCAFGQRYAQKIVL